MILHNVLHSAERALPAGRPTDTPRSAFYSPDAPRRPAVAALRTTADNPPAGGPADPIDPFQDD